MSVSGYLKVETWYVFRQIKPRTENLYQIAYFYQGC